MQGAGSRAVAGAELKFSGFDWAASEGYLEHLQRVDLTAAADQAKALTKVRRKWFLRNVDHNLPLRPDAQQAAQAEEPTPVTAAASAMLRGADASSGCVLTAWGGSCEGVWGGDL